MSVARCQQEVSSYEFVEWLAYERIAPGDPERTDYHVASIRSTIANVFGNRTKPEDFLPRRSDGLSIKDKLKSAWGSRIRR